LGEAISSGPTIVGDESGGTGVAAATGEALADGVAPELTGAVWPDASAHAFC
jgi:hypothetical protein